MELQEKYKFAAIPDCSHKAILPGLIDLHGYVGWSIMKSLAKGLSDAEMRTFTNGSSSQLTDERMVASCEAQMCALDRVKFGITFMFSRDGCGNGTRTDDPVFTRLAARGLVGLRRRSCAAGNWPGALPWPRSLFTLARWREKRPGDCIRDRHRQLQDKLLA